MTTRMFFVNFLAARSLIFASYCGLALFAYFSPGVEREIVTIWFVATGLLQVLIRRVALRWLRLHGGTIEQSPAR